MDCLCAARLILEAVLQLVGRNDKIQKVKVISFEKVRRGNMVDILYVYGDILRRGGMESHMMNYFRYADKEKVHIDFCVQSYDSCGGVYDDEIRQRGSEIFVLPKFSKRPLAYMKGLKALLSSGRYQVVHSHCDAMNYRVLRIAEECGVPVRIAHSHNTQHVLATKLKYAYYEFCRKRQSKYATDRWACSMKAGRWLFDGYEFSMIPNAIPCEKFFYDASVRDAVRREYGLSDSDIVLGHVGRFDYQKNHAFLVRVLRQLNDPRYKLMLVGDGWLRQQIEEQVQKEKLEEQVIFVGEVPDPHRYYNAMDLLIQPSLFEGFPVVLLEAQANGLHAIVSDCVTDEVNLFGSVTFQSLQEEQWVNAIRTAVHDRVSDAAEQIDRCGYNIKTAALKLSDKYAALVSERT